MALLMDQQRLCLRKRGGAPPFDPTTVPEVIARYTASGSVTAADGAKFGAASDLIGSHHLSQGTAGNQYYWHASGGPQNKPYCSDAGGFNGFSSWMNLAGTPSVAVVYALVRSSGYNFPSYCAVVGNSNAGSRCMLFQNSGTGRSGFYTVAAAEKDRVALAAGSNWEHEPAHKWAVYKITLVDNSPVFFGRQDGAEGGIEWVDVILCSAEPSAENDAALVSLLFSQLDTYPASSSLISGMPAGRLLSINAADQIYTDYPRSTPATAGSTVQVAGDHTGTSPGLFATGLPAVTYQVNSKFGINSPALRFSGGSGMVIAQTKAMADAMASGNYGLSGYFVCGDAGEFTTYQAIVDKSSSAGHGALLLRAGLLRAFGGSHENDLNLKHYGPWPWCYTSENLGGGSFKERVWVRGGLVWESTNTNPLDHDFPVWVGNNVLANLPFTGDMKVPVEFWGHTPSDAEAQAITRKYVADFDTSDVTLLGAGNSRMWGSPVEGTDAGTCILRYIHEAWGDIRPCINGGVSGDTWPNVQLRLPTQVQPFLGAGLNVLMLNEDVNSGVSRGNATQVYADRVACISAARAIMGPSGIIIVCDMLPSNMVAQSLQDDLNALTRADFPVAVGDGYTYTATGGGRAQGGADYMCRLTNDPTIGFWGAQNNTANYTDGTHETPAGRQIEASRWKTAVDYAIAHA